MSGILLGILFVFTGPVALGLLSWRLNDEHWEASFWTCLAAFCLALFTIPGGVSVIPRMTSGLCPNYSVGVREGYITKVSRKGVIWKTWEIEVQVGTGEMAALQAPHEFSVDETMINSVEANLGKRCRVSYTEWLLMPYRIGSSGYEITKVEPCTANGGAQ